MTCPKCGSPNYTAPMFLPNKEAFDFCTDFVVCRPCGEIYYPERLRQFVSSSE